jgi:hypothetical protein
MNCLHGKPAVCSTTSNGTFWFCGENPSCNFFCVDNECDMFEKAITAWRCTEQQHPRCRDHDRLARMCVVKDLMKENYGRPFFVCSERGRQCSFWMWGDVYPVAKPLCGHGLPCAIRKVKKDGLNKDRLFFCCANNEGNRCRFFGWAPEERVGCLQTVDFAKQPLGSSDCKNSNLLTVEFMNKFSDELKL